jgi:glycosyltransferase involved in cell wall biosynthesis
MCCVSSLPGAPPPHAETPATRLAFYGFRGGAGGVSRVMLNLINTIAGRGVAVEVLLHDARIPELDDLHRSVRVVRLGRYGRVAMLAAYLRREPPAVLLANREPALRNAVLARRLGGAPTRIAVRVGMTISNALHRRGAAKRWLRRWTIRQCYRRAETIIANSRGVAEDIVAVTGLPPERIHVIDNPTVSCAMRQLARQPVAHPWLEDGGPPLILGIGRLVRQKDFPTLVRAFARVRAERPCRLMILGEGKQRESLTSLAHSLGVQAEVALPGFVANPYAFLARAALFVLSSAWEGSPNVLIEALALGVPVVATDCHSGPREILEQGRFGPLVPVGDATALAAAMRATLAAPLPAESLRQAVARFDAGCCAERYLQALGVVLP